MNEQSNYGTRIFVLIVAIVLFASLSRIKSLTSTADQESPHEKLTHVQKVSRP